MKVELLLGIGDVDEAAWRALEPEHFPFFDLEFLRALESSGSIGKASGLVAGLPRL
jgi:predicted N-acyltransferase